MSAPLHSNDIDPTTGEKIIGRQIDLHGTVQGVGMRPSLWRQAMANNLRGQVWNHGSGVTVHAWGTEAQLRSFLQTLQTEAPPLARIDSVEHSPLPNGLPVPPDFTIRHSERNSIHTAIAADAATCPQCLAEIMDPADRRYRYPFANCTHCGPRLSIISAMPYDRANTSMAGFPLCPACEEEYNNPEDRRFHAQPVACPECGPELWVEDERGEPLNPDPRQDAIQLAAQLIRDGKIVAIKGLGGFHLACDAGNGDAVTQLRQRKHRPHKAFALMAQDIAMVERYATVSEEEVELLSSPAAPVVLLGLPLPTVRQDPGLEALPDEIAPGLSTLGFMLPYTPLHHLLMAELSRPIVLTSGNPSHRPQCIDNDVVRTELAGIADAFLLHDRDILNRLDDSVARVIDGKPVHLRRARGYAPQPLQIFNSVPERETSVLAMGGELKNSFCLLRDGEAILSQHMGDLEDAITAREYRRAIALYRQLYDFRPDVIVVDKHPDYLSTQLGKAIAEEEQIPLFEVQHHHAHIAACMTEHQLPPETKVLGIALDGLGMGDQRPGESGNLWGGEFLLADYQGYQHLAGFDPVPMPGGAKCMTEPWRNTFAHLYQLPEWPELQEQYSELELFRFLRQQSLETMGTMINKGLNAPLASSAGRLFDAVAAALGICREGISYEGQAAMELETLALPHISTQKDKAYKLKWRGEVLTWNSLWKEILADLYNDETAGVISARFHIGLTNALAEQTTKLVKQHSVEYVVASGGVFQNRTLQSHLKQTLSRSGIQLLLPAAVPANDGGLSLGQAIIGKNLLANRSNRLNRNS